MSTLPADAATVLRALQGQFSLRDASAEAAMNVFLPVLKARDAEIARLEGEVAFLRSWVLAAACNSEGLMAQRSLFDEDESVA